jgi:hypothetical protein
MRKKKGVWNGFTRVLSSERKNNEHAKYISMINKSLCLDMFAKFREDEY